MKKENAAPFYWGILHGVNDWVAGYLLARYTIHASSHESFFALCIYAILAFGGQLPVGIWLDKNRDIKSFGIVSVFLLLLACILSFINPMIAIIMAGIASAGVHVVGGCVCLMVNKDKITPLGIFTAPGIAGLTIGGFLGAININWIMLPFSIALLCLIFIVRKGFPVYLLSKRKDDTIIDKHDMIMILLLLFMCFRSLLFDLLNNFSQNMEYGILVVGMSAFIGKIIGGGLADRIGWKRWVYISLSIAIITLQFGHDNIFEMAVGIACLQSSVPITLQLLYSCLPSFPASASALSLGTVVALAGIPLYQSDYLQNTFVSSKSAYLIMVTVVLVIIYVIFIAFIKKSKMARNI